MMQPSMPQMQSQAPPMGQSPLSQGATITHVPSVQAQQPQQPPTQINGGMGVDASQRMARANEMQQRLSSGPGPPQQQQQQQHAMLSNLQAPSLLNWAKEQTSRSGASFSDREPGFNDPCGMNTLHNLPPPPRCAPASESFSGMPGNLGGADAAAGIQFALKVLTSDNRWETMTFTSGDDLQRISQTFLSRTGLKGAFQSGLVSKMQSMISQGQAQSSVDIVDLI